VRNANPEGSGRGGDRCVPLVRVEVLGGGHKVVLVPLQAIHQTVFGSNGMGGRWGARTIAQGLVGVKGEEASF